MTRLLLSVGDDELSQKTRLYTSRSIPGQESTLYLIVLVLYWTSYILY